MDALERSGNGAAAAAVEPMFDRLADVLVLSFPGALVSVLAGARGMSCACSSR